MLFRSPGNQGSNQGLNYIEVIPSPFADEEEKDRASLRVMTRAQTSKSIDKEEPPASEAAQKKSRKRYNRRGRPKKEEKKPKSGSEPRQPANEQKEPREEKKEPEHEDSATTRTSSTSSRGGGSVLIDKRYEPLEAAVRAYEDRVEAQLDLPEKLKQYPNAREERTQLESNRQRIWETQTMMEGPMPTQPQGPKKLKPSLETILEVSSRRERARTESNAEPEFNSQASWEATFPEEIPAADEEIVSSLWREVRGKTNKARSGIGLPPFSFMRANQPLEDQWAADSLNQRTAT